MKTRTVLLVAVNDRTIHWLRAPGRENYVVHCRLCRYVRSSKSLPLVTRWLEQHDCQGP